MTSVDFAQDSETFEAHLVPIVKRSKDLSISKHGQRHLKLHSKAHFGWLSMIEPHLYYIDLKWQTANGATTVSYKSRGNATYSIMAFVVPLFSIPSLVFVISNSELATMGKLTVLGLYSLFMIGWVVWMLLKMRQGQRKGLQVINHLLQLVKEQLI